MSDLCERCGTPCDDWVKISIKNSFDHEGSPLHCLVVALAGGIAELYKTAGPEIGSLEVARIILLLHELLSPPSRQGKNLH